MAHAIHTRSANLSVWEMVKDFSARVLLKAQQRMIYRTTLTELNGLSARELADLGIARSMIKRIAMEAAYGEDAK